LFYDVSVCWDSSGCSEHLKAFVLLKQILRYCLLTPCSTCWLYLVCPPFWSDLRCLEAHVFNWVYLKFWFCMEVREYLQSDGCQCLLKYVWQVCPSSCIVLVLTFVNLHAFFSSPGKGVKSQLSQQLSTNIARQRRCVLLWNLCGAVVRLQGEHGSWGLVPLPAVLICMCECWRETALVLVKMHPSFGIGRSQSHWAQKVSMWFVNF
jgi:hypothetical protein